MKTCRFISTKNPQSVALGDNWFEEGHDEINQRNLVISLFCWCNFLLEMAPRGDMGSACGGVSYSPSAVIVMWLYFCM